MTLGSWHARRAQAEQRIPARCEGRLAHQPSGAVAAEDCKPALAALGDGPAAGVADKLDDPGWRLAVGGRVARPATLTLDDLQAAWPDPWGTPPGCRSPVSRAGARRPAGVGCACVTCWRRSAPRPARPFGSGLSSAAATPAPCSTLPTPVTPTPCWRWSSMAPTAPRPRLPGAARLRGRPYRRVAGRPHPRGLRRGSPPAVTPEKRYQVPDKHGRSSIQDRPPARARALRPPTHREAPQVSASPLPHSSGAARHRGTLSGTWVPGGLATRWSRSPPPRSRRMGALPSSGAAGSGSAWAWCW
jgi:hypothetical protein